MRANNTTTLLVHVANKIQRRSLYLCSLACRRSHYLLFYPGKRIVSYGGVILITHGIAELIKLLIEQFSPTVWLECASVWRQAS